MEIFVYCKDSDQVEKEITAEKLPPLLADKDNLVWIDIENPTEEDNQLLSDIFSFHPLTIEDAIETRNHPKVEFYGKYLFLIVHGVTTKTNSANFVTNELDIYLGENFLLTYHHDALRSVDAVKTQVHSNTFVCERGSDYLLHQILDHLADQYIPVINDFDDAINDLKKRIFGMKTNNNKILEEISDLERSAARLVRISSKQLDVLSRLARGEFPFIDEDVLPFYRDVYDHLHRVSAYAENYRDQISGLLHIHFNVVASRTNDIVKFLTIFSAVWLPLSFIAGIYGMNFDYMPELKTRNGYFFTLGLMAAVAASLLLFFWRKGWIFKKDTEESSDEKDK